jgi:hypothetical protein
MKKQGIRTLAAALLAALLLGALSLKVRGGAHSAHRHR